MSETKFTERRYLKSRGVALNTFEEVYTTPTNELYPTTAVVIKTETGKIGVGTSTASPDENFDANKGLKIARDRAIADLIEDGSFYGDATNLAQLAKDEAEADRDDVIERKAEWLNRKFDKMEKQMRELAAKYGFGLESNKLIDAQPALPSLPAPTALLAMLDLVDGLFPYSSRPEPGYFERLAHETEDEQW